MTSKTDATGNSKFSNLQPQKYYLTAILKEYNFAAIDAVEIFEGVHSEIVVSGKRVAWSAYGSVRTLGDAAVSDCIVTAVHKNLIEKALCSQDGSFKVMGLMPGKVYSLSVVSELAARVVPVTLNAQVAESSPADLSNMMFYVVPVSPSIEIAGSVFFEGEETTKASPKLYREKPPISVEVFVKGENMPIRTSQL